MHGATEACATLAKSTHGRAAVAPSAKDFVRQRLGACTMALILRALHSSMLQVPSRAQVYRLRFLELCVM
jgi:hypothetical protein